jgi:foldase protein PrsA
MVIEALVKQEARKRHLTVTQEDIDAEMTKLADQLKANNKSADEIDSTLKDLYNWTRDQFIAQVLKPFVLRDKLGKAISEDPVETEKAKTKADEALKKIKDGTDFATVAGEYSEDTLSKTQGGDLGWFGKGEMVADFENAVFALKVGDVSDLVKTSYGYHIIKLVDKKTEKVDGQDVEKVRASHILIRTKSIDDWLSEARKSAKVTYWISSLKPDAAGEQVTAPTDNSADTNKPAPEGDQNVNTAVENTNE